MKNGPLCRYCGVPLKKRTETVIFNNGRGTWQAGSGRPERPTSKDQVQRLVNQKIVSIQYREDEQGRYVSQVTTWDGVTYRDQFFCKGEHAQRFAYSSLRHSPTLGTEAYHKALKQQLEGEHS